MKAALLVGIDHYEGAGRLRGCVNDARSLKALLARNDDDTLNFECVERVSGETGPVLTADALRSDIERILTSEADTVVIHFSGHGTVDSAHSALVAQDLQRLRLNDVIELMADSSVRQTVLTLDCCFAGGVGTGQFLAADVSALPEGVAVLAAARGTEAAAESGGSGLFTGYLAAALDGGAADVVGRVTVAGLYAYLDEAFGVMEQRPVLKANLTRLVDLRHCEPLVPLSTLRELPDLFPTPEYEFHLDPQYEDSEEDHDPSKVAVFKKLQDCFAARLVVPIDERFMYYAAMNSKSCRLTALGQRYWRLADEGRL